MLEEKWLSKDQTNDANTYRCPLPSLGALKIEGDQARQFLQGQTTCDLNRLSAEQGLWGAHCNVKGRAVANFFVGQWHEELYLITDKSNLKNLRQSLEKYGQFSKLTFIEPSCNMIALVHKGQPPEIKQWLSPKASPFALSTSSTGFWLRLSSQLSLLCLFQENEAIQSLTASYSETALLGFIESGLALIDASTSEQFIPIELNMDLNHGISFDKGCYLGQEIIARLHYRGSPKVRLHRVALPAGSPALPSIATIRQAETDTGGGAGKRLGTLVCAVQTSAGRGQALMVGKAELSPGNTLTGEVDNTPITVRVLPTLN